MRLTRAKKSQAERGFSLVELIVVAGLMLVMFVLYYGRGSKQFQSAQQVICRQNLQFAFTALQTYASDNKNLYPRAPGSTTSEAPLSLLVPRSTTKTEIFICPGTKRSKLPEGQPFANRRISYAYVMGLTNNSSANLWILSDEQVNTSPKQPGQTVFSIDGKGPGRNHDKYGGDFLWADGRAGFSPAQAAFAVTNPPQTVVLNPKP